MNVFSIFRLSVSLACPPGPPKTDFSWKEYVLEKGGERRRGKEEGKGGRERKRCIFYVIFPCWLNEWMDREEGEEGRERKR